MLFTGLLMNRLDGELPIRKNDGHVFRRATAAIRIPGST